MSATPEQDAMAVLGATTMFAMVYGVVACWRNLTWWMVAFFVVGFVFSACLFYTSRIVEE